jgi:outer membrane protein OmpA-like peptidoglycan-associated protein
LRSFLYDRLVAWSVRWRSLASRRQVLAGRSSEHRSSRRRWLNRLRKQRLTRKPPPNRRDSAKQAQANSEAQAELARQQAAAEQQKANEATRQAEQYRREREAELAQLQQALGQIAQTRRTAMGLVMTLDSKSVRFEFDKSDIKPEYRDTLNRVAGILMTLKGYTIDVYGYTDDVGTQTYNLQLSQRRAEAVRDFLVQAGISPTIMSTKGFGKSDPRVSGDSEQARAANRRVEIGIVDSTLLPNIRPIAPN